MGIQRRSVVVNQGTGYQQVDNQTLGGNAGDIPLVRTMYRPVDFGGSSTGTVFNAAASAAVGTFSDSLTVEGCQFVIVRTEFEKTNGSIVLRPFLADIQATNVGWSAGDDVTIAAQTTKNSTSIPTLHNSAWYHGRRVVVPTYGAKLIKFLLVTNNNPKATVWAVGA